MLFLLLKTSYKKRMRNEVVNYYENYREEDRITTNNARKIEFITTIKKFDVLFGENLSILDCAAGTGAYAFYLAEKGNKVTATDITPRHIEIINKELECKSYSIDTEVLDATDMSCFKDESFDIVLNMGPFYHLTDMEARKRCLSESLRVLKKGGLLVTAYIPRLYLNQRISMSDSKYVDEQFLSQIRDTGVLLHDDPKCFWTDTYYSSYDEMERLYKDNALEIIDHFAQDGMTPMFRNQVDAWSDEKFKTWCDYHFSICSQKSVIDMSNHSIIVGKKN